MSVCIESVYLMLVSYIILSKILFFVAVRYLEFDLEQTLITLFIFEMIFIIDVYLLLTLFGGVCS